MNLRNKASSKLFRSSPFAAAMLFILLLMGFQTPQTLAVSAGETFPIYMSEDMLTEAQRPTISLSASTGALYCPGSELFYGWAIRDLRDYLQQMTGATYPLTALDPAAQSGIFIGRFDQYPSFSSAQPGFSSSDPESFVIEAQGNKLFILGKKNFGLIAGIYTFLDQRGCRWYAPGKVWENIPSLNGLPIDSRLNTSSVRASYRLRAPVFDYADVALHRTNALNDATLWQLRNRLGGSEFVLNLHNGSHLIDQSLFSTRPELFGLINGVRNQYEVAKSNQETISKTVDTAVNYLTSNHGKGSYFDSFSVEPNDGFKIDEEATALFGGSASTAQWNFANKVAEGLAARGFTNKWIGGLAYGNHAMPPNVDLHPQVGATVTTALSFNDDGTPISLTVEQRLDGFVARKCKRLGIYDYLNVPNWVFEFPGRGMKPQSLSSRLRSYHAHGATGYIAESGYSSVNHGLQHYLLTRLLWNIQADPNAETDGYYAAFGPASAKVRALYEDWWSVYTSPGEIESGNLGVVVDADRINAIAVPPGQWLRIDLGQSYNVSRINVSHVYDRIYKDVIVQLSNDPAFPKAATITVFNNDTDNSSGHGIGTDAEYVEPWTGKDIFLSSPINARYARFWSNGSNFAPDPGSNHYREVEIYEGSSNIAMGKAVTVSGFSASCARWYQLISEADQLVAGNPTYQSRINMLKRYFIYVNFLRRMASKDPGLPSKNDRFSEMVRYVASRCGEGVFSGKGLFISLMDNVRYAGAASNFPGVDYNSLPSDLLTLHNNTYLDESWRAFTPYSEAQINSMFAALQAELSATTVVSAPTGLSATPGNGQVSLNWTAASGALSYNVKRGTIHGGPYVIVGANITTTSYANTGLNNGTIYYYVVSAVYSTGESANSIQVSATPVASATVPAAPTGLSATAGNGQVSLSWAASSGATSYNVKRATTSGGPYTTIASNLTTTSFTNTGLTNGTTYYYVVSASNSAGQSGNSNQVSAAPVAPATIPAAPTGLSATAGNGQVSLSWTASSGATSYNVKRATTSGGPYTIIASNVTSTSYTNTGLTNGTTYYYVVSASNSAGESANSTQVSAKPNAPTSSDTTAPTIPSNLSAAAASSTQINLSWSPSSDNIGVTGYRVYRQDKGLTPIATVTGTSYSNSGLLANTAYTYYVTAIDAAGNSSQFSNSASATTHASAASNVPAAPSNLSAKAISRSQINLAWADNSNNETGFKIERKEGTNGVFVEIATVGAGVRSYSSTGLKRYTTYYYRVRAANAAGNSAYSNIASARTF